MCIVQNRVCIQLESGGQCTGRLAADKDRTGVGIEVAGQRRCGIYGKQSASQSEHGQMLVLERAMTCASVAQNSGG